MIEGIDAKLKVLLAEKAQSAEMEVEAPVKEAVPKEKSEVPIYRETANYAYEAGELESYRASLAANVECRRAIEAAKMCIRDRDRRAEKSRPLRLRYGHHPIRSCHLRR